MSQHVDSSRGDGVDCSVLVPVLNEERHLRATVGAMRGQRFAGEIEFLLVDGESTDGTRGLLEQLAREDPRIRVLPNPRRGTPSGLNVGLAHARGRWVARMDGHSEYPAEYLQRGVERLARGDTTWVSGPQVPRGTGTVSRAVALALGGVLGRGGSRKWGVDSGQGEEYDLDSGVFAGVWERDTLLRYGGWDERWLRNQDSELAGRFLARGERLVCLPAMAAFYVPRDSLRGLWRQYRQYGEYRTKTAIRHPHTLRRSHLLAPAVVVDAVLSAVGPPGFRLRSTARLGLLLYASALLSAGLQARRRAEHAGDAVLVPAVLALMHVGHGVGMLIGVARFGVPWAALRQVVGLGADGDRRAGAEPVYAPSLRPLSATN